MAEDLAVVHTKAFTGGDSTEAATAIANCITASAGAGYWENDPSVTVGSGELALRPTQQLLGDADNQRIAIRAQASGVLQFGYAPAGWAITSLADLDTAPPTVWSGWRNITGTATGFGATIVRVWVTQYRDQFDVATAPNPASSLAVIVGTASTWNHGAHVGRIIATDNASDPNNDIFGDALLVGTPTAVATTVGGWLRGSNTSNPANASVIRTGERWWSYTRIADVLAITALADLAGARRAVPLNLYGHGNALPTGDDVTHAGIIGQCKYLRRQRQALGFGAYLQSSTSAQRWTAVVPSTTDTDHVILWAAATEVP
jgi:hypothetical protein